MTEPDVPEARDTLTRVADALDVLLAADEAHLQRIAELEEYIRELEADTVRATQGQTAAEEQAKEFATANAALTLELRGTRKLLRAADLQLEQVRAKEVEPLAERVALLMAQLAALREGAATAETNVIAYRFPGDGTPDIVVRWRGGDRWSITDGMTRCWTVDKGWVLESPRLDPELTRFSRADALAHAQTLMEAAREKTKERNP